MPVHASRDLSGVWMGIEELSEGSGLPDFARRIPALRPRESSAESGLRAYRDTPGHPPGGTPTSLGGDSPPLLRAVGFRLGGEDLRGRFGGRGGLGDVPEEQPGGS